MMLNENFNTKKIMFNNISSKTTNKFVVWLNFNPLAENKSN